MSMMLQFHISCLIGFYVFMMKMEVTHKKNRAPNALNMIIYLYGEMEKCMPSEQTYTARSLYKDSGARVFCLLGIGT